MIKNYIVTVATFFVLCLMSSCFSTLKVKVDVFDHEALINSIDYKRKEATQLINEIKSKNFDALKQELVDSLYADLKVQKMDSQSKEAAVNSYSRNIDSYLKDVKKLNLQAIKVLNTFLQKQVDSLMTEAKGKIDSSNLVLDVFGVQVKKLHSDLVKSKDAVDFEKIKVRFGQIVDQLIQNNLTVYGESIFSDPLASLIARAPDKYWSKYPAEFDLSGTKSSGRKSGKDARYNFSRVNTFMGNADIAIKMDEPGNFVVKGIRMDADESLKATFKLLNQSIKYFAVSGGVPIPGANENSPAISIPEIAENNDSKLQYETLKKDYDNALANLITIFETQTNAIKKLTQSKKDIQKEKEAIQIMNAAFLTFSEQFNHLNSK